MTIPFDAELEVCFGRVLCDSRPLRLASFAIRIILPDAKETNFVIESLSFNLPLLLRVVDFFIDIAGFK